MTIVKRVGWLAAIGLLALTVGLFWTTGTPPAEAANPCNPCAANPCNPCGANPCNPCAANPCAANPCAANPCAANPCAANPCGANPCNPCGGNPCNPCGGAAGAKASDFVQPKGVRIAKATAALASRGEKLWNDPSLSSNGLACATCHVGGSQMNASSAKPYPHRVAMVSQQSGVSEVNTAEMIQFCMLTPMASDPLPWDSVELAALTAHVQALQKDFVPSGAPQANPCNPCGANPCNPCAANPCNPRSG